jgi:excinuclease ABC subunit C
MIFHIRDFGFSETASELLALLLEDRLIKNHWPQYNVRQREFGNYQYLALSRGPYPAIERVNTSGKDSHERLFGPFPDRYFAQNMLDIIHKHFHLRACREHEPVRRCLNHDIHICKGPCRGMITRDEYAILVDRVIDFLNGNERVIMERMIRIMEEAAKRLDFEKAAQMKERMGFIKRTCKRQRFIHAFKNTNLVIHENGLKALTHVIVQGNCTTWPGLQSEIEIHRIISEVRSGDSACKEDDRHLLDRANIVHDWITRNRDHTEYYFLPGDRGDR